MDEEKTLESFLPSKEVRGIQMLLYKNLMQGTLTVELLKEFKQFLDLYIVILACESCSKSLDFGECIYNGDISESCLEEHLNLIESGYCFCHDTDAVSPTKVVGLKLIHRLAVSDRNLPFLAYLHENNCDINTLTLHSNKSPLVIAIGLQQVETVRYLVEHGAEVNLGDGSAQRIAPIRLALHTGKTEILKLLLDVEGIEIDVIRDSYNESLLAESLRQYSDVAEMLLKAGADPNVTDRYGRTPLTAMASARNTEMVSLLIQHGASVNRKDGVNSVPLLRSVRQGDSATATVLLEAGADPNFRSPYEEKSLITLASYTGFNDVIKVLMKYGGDVNSYSDNNYAAIHIAAWNGHCETVQLLLDAGAECDIPTQDQNTPLALAAHGGHLEVIKLLISQGCNVNNTDRDGDTPLLYVAKSGLADCVKLLLEHGADPNICDSEGTSPLWLAVYNGRQQVVKQLLSANVKKEIPSRGMDRHAWSDEIYYFYDNPKTPLFVSVDKKHLDIALLLIDAGYNIHREKWLLNKQFFESEEKAEILNTLLEHTDIPLRLLTICSNYLRTYFGQCLDQSINKLDLPTRLQKYLTLTDMVRETE